LAGRLTKEFRFWFQAAFFCGFNFPRGSTVISGKMLIEISLSRAILGVGYGPFVRIFVLWWI
jgi:hypothetical protein